MLIALVFVFTTEPIPEIDQESKDFLALDEDQQDYVTELVENIRSGGPGKDGIPAVDDPQYESVDDANEWLLANDIVFGVIDGDQAYAYPQRIVVWHEIVNIEHDGMAASVTYCPLTGSAIGYYAPNQDADDPTFGVSGKLVNSNLIMYDRETDSYWPQIAATAITGDYLGSELESFDVIWTTWKQWSETYPDTVVMSRDTGFLRDYSESGDPYGSYLDESGYYFSDNLLFAPIYEDDRLDPKEVVIGTIDEDGQPVAYLTSSVDDRDSVGGFEVMWFAWYAYYPETKLIQ